VNGKRAPEISVVVPVFNTAELVRASVSSVLEHTRAGIEIICVDDGSTDGSAEILGLLAANDDRVCVVRLGTNHGASTARNSGIERAKGDYVFFLDSDDMVPPGALDLLLSAARQTGSALTIGKLLWFRSVAESTSPLEQTPGNPVVVADIRESDYLQSVPGCHCCNLYARDLLEQHHIRYETDLTYGEDQLFQATAMVCAGKVTIVDEMVYVYHHYRGQSLTRKPPGLKNLLDDLEYKRRMGRLFLDHGMEDTARRTLGFWSYSIRQYWLQIPESLSREEASAFFSSFRSMAAEFAISAWSEKTPDHHRHLLGLIMSGQDEQALAFLATAEAHAGSLAMPRPAAELR